MSARAISKLKPLRSPKEIAERFSSYSTEVVEGVQPLNPGFFAVQNKARRERSASAWRKLADRMKRVRARLERRQQRQP